MGRPRGPETPLDYLLSFKFKKCQFSDFFVCLFRSCFSIPCCVSSPFANFGNQSLVHTYPHQIKDAIRNIDCDIFFHFSLGSNSPPESCVMQACYFAGSCPACQKEAKNLDSQDFMDISKLAKIHIEKGYAVVGITGYFL